MTRETTIFTLAAQQSDRNDRGSGCTLDQEVTGCKLLDVHLRWDGTRRSAPNDLGSLGDTDSRQTQINKRKMQDVLVRNTSGYLLSRWDEMYTGVQINAGCRICIFLYFYFLYAHLVGRSILYELDMTTSASRQVVTSSARAILLRTAMF